MTAAARLVLLDCRQALQLFVGDVEDSRWRIIYMANVALLRAVYHVLKLRDVPANPKLSSVFRQWDSELLASRPDPEIYWSFIVDERNLLVKEYRATPVHKQTSPEVQFDPSTGRADDMGTLHHKYLMSEGPFEGQDQRRLIKSAIAWWQAQLALLEARVDAA